MTRDQIVDVTYEAGSGSIDQAEYGLVPDAQASQPNNRIDRRSR